MKISDFYPGQQNLAGSAANALEVPPEQRAIGSRPVHFWLVLVALLVGARVLYEMGGEVK